jgi:two-component system CheB/CheR fusion protein
VLATWEVVRTGPTAWFLFHWQEQGGPPVQPPDHRGFGTELLERAIVEDFDRPAAIEFAPDGLRFEIDVPCATIRA